MRVLVTGAAGYIGSHVARALEEAGHEAVRLDDFSTGHEENLAGAPCVEARAGDREAVGEALRGVDAVAHLAGAALVPESMTTPAKYWRRNVADGLGLVEAMVERGVRRLVFSSTCAVHGTPARVPIEEDAPHAPQSPYGASKSAFERLIADVAMTGALEPVVFRYFNAVGAHEAGDIGEIHEPETHLVPLVLAHLAGRGEGLVIHGADYPTPDGTCVRDYVDVRDIARAHVLALEAACAGALPPRATMNLGRGTGHSVREVVTACERAAGRRASPSLGRRRPGDPPELVAAVGAARRLLGWTAQHDLEASVRAAWAFERRRHAAPA